MRWSGFLLFFVGILMSKRFKVAASFRHDYKYENVTDTYYKAHQAETWISAVQICASEGAFLACPYSFFEAMLMGKVFLKFEMDVSNFWIGSSSVYSKDAEGPFLTVEGKSSDTVLTAWEKGYPINDNVGRCVVYNSATLKMKNVQYNKTYPFMCLKRNFTEPDNNLTNYDVTTSYLGYTSISDSLEALVKVYREKVDFLTAMQICAREGGKLGAPLNNYELKVYKSLIREELFHWLGMTDGFGTRYFHFVDGDETPNPFLNWAEGKPDNSLSRNWFTAMDEKGNYADFTGDELMYFICAKHRRMTYHNNPKNFATSSRRK